MTDKKQPVNVKILERVMEVKDLERTLREDNPFYQDPEKLRKLGSVELNDEENERFVEGYSDFVDSYVKDVISGRLQAIYDENAEVFDGTPEGRYVQNLIESSGRPMVKRGGVYDIRIENLDLSSRAKECLQDNHINYLGQLVQRTEHEMLIRIPESGIRTLDELKEFLEERGLHFGMEIDYVSPEERE